MDSLRQLSSPTAVVIRDGQPVIVPSKHVVPGDVVQIKAGDVIPADVSTLAHMIEFHPDYSRSCASSSSPIWKYQSSCLLANLFQVKIPSKPRYLYSHLRSGKVN